MVRKSLNTHGTLLVYLLRRLLTVGCFQKNRFGEIVNSGSQNNSKVQSTLKEAFCRFRVYCRLNRSNTFIFANKLFAYFENATDGNPQHSVLLKKSCDRPHETNQNGIVKATGK